jgi:FdhD protein
MEPIRTFTITRSDSSAEQTDELAVEEPLELRLDGHPVAVMMRTPGHDTELAAGFLVTEGIVPHPDRVRKFEWREDENRMLVFLHDEVRVDLARLSRHLFTASSCGLCGKATLEAIFTTHPPLERRPPPTAQALLTAPERLREAQKTFQKTGGLHAAGFFSDRGDLLVAREDVGRHNAVDKVIGHALLEGIDLGAGFLLVSGRLSFEIVQKALAARIPALAAISAPSSLAVEFARESGQTLIGFLRPPGYNLYTPR